MGINKRRVIRNDSLFLAPKMVKLVKTMGEVVVME